MTCTVRPTGGDDTLTGGGSTLTGTGMTSYLYGDANSMSDNAHGGDDRLISGTGTDHMWGDAQFINGVAASPTAPTGAVVTGADTFVVAPGSGNDDINDFRQSDHDRIDVNAYGFTSLVDMTIPSTARTPGSASTPRAASHLWALSIRALCTSSDFIFA